MKYLIPYSLIIIEYLIMALCCLKTTIISWFIQNIANTDVIVFTCFIFFLFGSISLILYSFIKSDTNTEEKRLMKLTLITYPIIMAFTAVYSVYETAIR